MVEGVVDGLGRHLSGWCWARGWNISEPQFPHTKMELGTGILTWTYCCESQPCRNVCESSLQMLVVSSTHIKGTVPVNSLPTHCPSNPWNGWNQLQSPVKVSVWDDSAASLSGEVYYRSKYLRSDTYNANIEANRIVVSEFGTMAYPDPCKNIFSK